MTVSTRSPLLLSPRQRRDAIRTDLEGLAPLVAAAYKARDWEHFGYDSWTEFVSAEFGNLKLALPERQTAVIEMRSTGMSTRAIADVVGASKDTVHRDLSTVSDETVDLPESVTGVDGKQRPAKRPPPASEPTPAVPHPAKYSASLFAVFEEMLPDNGRILDPFAGVGGIHRLATSTRVTVGVELEPEWAHQHPDTIVGNALDLSFDDHTFDAIVTSPAYANRMADTYAGDGTTRHTYRIALDRDLHPNNGGGMQWGDPYRELHRTAWIEALRVLKPRGRFILNISDHVRKGERQSVTAWHMATLLGLGFTFHDLVPVVTPRNRNGANSNARAAAEMVIAFDSPGETR